MDITEVVYAARRLSLKIDLRRILISSWITSRREDCPKTAWDLPGAGRKDTLTKVDHNYDGLLRRGARSYTYYKNENILYFDGIKVASHKDAVLAKDQMSS